MAFLNYIEQIEEILTNKLKDIIGERGLVKTGRLLRETFVRYSGELEPNLNEQVLDFNFKIVSTDYFDDLEYRFEENGEETMTEELLRSDEFKKCADLFADAIGELIILDLQRTLKNNIN